GKKTEVYSRITGYYRPVQNWNDGKAQEFKDRMVYDVGGSMLHRFHEPLSAAAAPAAAPSAVKLETKATGNRQQATGDEGRETATFAASAGADAPSGLLLFTTSTCPKCVMAKKFLADAGIAYETVVVDKTPELAKQYGVRQAPTLLVLENGKEVQRIENPSNIRRFCEDQGK
ncbi:MAG: hypothetical protein IKN31_06840, partial [Bacteroidales bacterium]|nr:hypothetical protein [Bacteroidales bacterium]